MLRRRRRGRRKVHDGENVSEEVRLLSYEAYRQLSALLWEAGQLLDGKESAQESKEG